MVVGDGEEKQCEKLLLNEKLSLFKMENMKHMKKYLSLKKEIKQKNSKVY